MSEVETREPFRDVTNKTSANHGSTAHTPAKQSQPQEPTETNTPKPTAAKKKTAKTSSTAALHSSYHDMIHAAFVALSEPKSGVSKHSILNYVTSVNHIEASKSCNMYVIKTLKKMHEKGEIKMCQSKNGRSLDVPFNATGSFKLVEVDTPITPSTRTTPTRKAAEPKTSTKTTKQPATKMKAATKESAIAKSKSATKLQESKQSTKKSE